MRRALVVSDVHTDIEGNAADELKSLWRRLDFDVLLCCGDVRAPGHKSIEWLASVCPHKPVLYVPGNHDFYSFFSKTEPSLKTTYLRERDAMRRRAEELGIHYLDNDSIVLEDCTRVLGTTMWTDMMLRPGYQMFGDAVRTAAKQMNDYRCIKTGEGRSRDNFQPRDSIAAHVEARRWLQEQLAIEHPEGDTIVMSHMAPHPNSLLHGRVVDPLDCCYASDLTPILTADTAPTHWFHGHIHSSRDYVIGNTHVVCNPRGYPTSSLKNAPRENPDFNPELVIEIGREPVPQMRM
ncbi:metallophosphoesterase [Bradyrhizobium sp. S69]|uniref:metallophosphoesterase n=1 Tax=Bradyrhizobium sp. S69 TaxID=1641856 RepID=UPI00131CB1E8|nr:metallophosphoesterase [Bradyrhizobium sp. S69]